MKDIDFDELDKAVNSLMGGVKNKSDREEAKTLTIATTLKEGEQPAYDKIQHAAERIGSETLTSPTEKTAVLTTIAEDQVNVINLPDTLGTQPVTPLIESIPPVASQAPIVTTTPVAPEPSTPQQPQMTPRAPSGRFMDVMHPSSDMKTASTSQASVVRPIPVAPVTPTGAVTAPSSIVVPSRPTNSVSIAPPAEVVQPVLETTPAVQSSEPSQESVITPPLPVITPPLPVITPAQPTLVAPEAIAPPVAPVTVESVPVVAETPVVIDTVETPEPLTSPFLPDAKVEKRPLGGPSDQMSGDVDDIDSLDHPYSVDNSSDTQLAPTQADRPELPAELRTDLLAIETNIAEPTEPSLVSTTTAGSNETQLAGGDTPVSGAVFDTTDYHSEVKHPAKHKSEWIWIGIIIGIIVICAAGAAAFYLLGSQ